MINLIEISTISGFFNTFSGFFLAFGTALCLIPVIILYTKRSGITEKPQKDRWHEREVAKLGGIAIYFGFLIPALLYARYIKPFYGLLIGSSAIFIFGLVDDLIDVKPHFKLLAQILSALILVFFGVRFALVESAFLNITLSVFWLVTITNAFNLLDNIDGLASGIAVISSLTIAVSSLIIQNPRAFDLALIIGGAALGFLIFNFNPAKIFMGDCGSMFLGMILGGISITGTWHQTSKLFFILAVPVLLLAVPVFDTTFVAVSRALRGRKISSGGKDHTSHRLVQLGMSERKAVLLLYGISLVFGTIALVFLYHNIFIAGIIFILVLIGIFLFGVFLGQVDIYERKSEEQIDPDDQSQIILNTLILYKRRIAEIIMDFFLICVSFFGAYLLRFGGVIDPIHQEQILKSLPLILVIKFLLFTYFGFYRGVWKYVGVYDLVRIFKGIIGSSVFSVAAILLLYRFENFSRAVFIIDGILCLMLIAGSRIMLRVFQAYFKEIEDNGGKRLLLAGAGDAGELILREIRNNPNMDYNPVAFIDDNEEKIGRKLHGIPIMGNRTDIPDIVEEKEIEEIVVSMPSVPDEQKQGIVRICENTGVPYRVVSHIHTAIDYQK